MRSFHYLLLISVLVIATCGLIYELIAGTLASYLLGDSVTQFSTIIGAYLFSMGIGSYLSKFFKKDLLQWFVRIEILIGLIGGFSSSVLFLAFEWVSSFRFLLYFLISLTGILVGLEIPLLMRVLNEMKLEFKDLVSRVFTFDYMGALVASIVFPLVLVPQLGLIRTSLFFGLLNVGIALILISKMKEENRKNSGLRAAGFIALIVLVMGFVFGERIMQIAEASAYDEKIIYTKSTPYQRIVLTKAANETRLYLNGNLQFSSLDEYRYHEALVHPAATACQKLEKVLILGGGDGFAVRELLRYPSIQQITLVDLDAQLVDLFRKSAPLRTLNSSAFHAEKLKVIHADAFSWVKAAKEKFDCIIIDFPDPSGYSLGKLYTNRFYRAVNQLLDQNGTMVVQSTSPYYAPNSFWCINQTMASEGFNTLPYHCYVPSFGEWGYVLATKESTHFWQRPLPEKLKFLTQETFSQMQNFPKDMANRPVEINRLNNQALVNYFEKEWAEYNS